jgi:cell division protein FtsB
VFTLTMNLAAANAEVADLRNQMDKMSKELVEKTAEIEALRGGSNGTTG